MRYRLSGAFYVCAGVLCAQTPEAPEIARAQANIEQLKKLVDAGAVPRAQLERARQTLADAQDEAYLRRTLYGEELTEDQTGEMIATAGRRLERKRQSVEQQEQLVREGVASHVSIGAFLEDQDRARKEYDLAVSRANLTHELAQMARAEEALVTAMNIAPAETYKIAEKFEGSGYFNPSELKAIILAFQMKFARNLPVSAFGETAVHRALGFDHRNRVDVAVHPDQPEGVWLRRYLEDNNIPYFAFRQAVPGKATAAHIHIGPVSGRLIRAGA